MNVRSFPGRLRAVPPCCVLIIGLLLGVSCSKSQDDSAKATESVFSKVRSQADPVAETTAGVAVAKLSNDNSSVDATVAEMRTAHSASVEELEASLCKTLQDAGGKASSERAEELRAVANQALRDSFVLKFMQAAAAASPERQAEIVKILDIKAKAADGAALEGAAALKDASLTSDQGSLQIPPTDSMEYTKYTNWLRANPALAGFATVTLTEDYTKAIQKCSFG